jgi:hypothetical protein
MAEEFQPSDPAAVVFVDTSKLVGDMERNGHYYVNNTKIATDQGFFEKRHFEAPVVIPRHGVVDWMGGFHQMTVAVDAEYPRFRADR